MRPAEPPQATVTHLLSRVAEDLVDGLAEVLEGLGRHGVVANVAQAGALGREVLSQAKEIESLFLQIVSVNRTEKPERSRAHEDVAQGERVVYDERLVLLEVIHIQLHHLLLALLGRAIQALVLGLLLNHSAKFLRNLRCGHGVLVALGIA